MRRFYPFVLTFILTLPLIPARAQQQDTALPVSQSAADQDKQSQAPPPLEETPVTVKPNDTGSKKTVDTDPVMGVPALPKGTTSLIGGRVSKIDGVHNRIGVKIFGNGGQWEMAFDERTHFFRDGIETTFENIKKGDRVYVDTMLDGHRILARNVRVVTHTTPADARGQVMDFNNGMMSIRDSLSARMVYFRVSDSTEVKRNGTAAVLADVRPGSLIVVEFSPGNKNRGEARAITLLAAPGENITFAGRVTHLDIRTGMLAVENRTDSQTYEIAFDQQGKFPSNLMLGSDVTVAAVFDGRKYKASNINVEPAAQ
jgi:hypothetical protein